MSVSRERSENVSAAIAAISLVAIAGTFAYLWIAKPKTLAQKEEERLRAEKQAAEDKFRNEDSQNIRRADR